jgi:hypothetical protein
MKHGANRRSVSSKAFVVMLALVLALGCAVGGTIAWLTANTDPVVNTFTYGDINIELYEHKYDAATNTLDESQKVDKVEDYKIVPGKNLPKDPTVKVVGGSEACYLFVKVVETGTFVADKVTYTIRADGWTKGDGTNIPTDVYYRVVPAATTDTAFYMLTGDAANPNGVVTVKDTLTKDDIKNITNPTLTFTAYAVQKDGIADAAAAWAKIGA